MYNNSCTLIIASVYCTCGAYSHYRNFSDFSIFSDFTNFNNFNYFNKFSNFGNLSNLNNISGFIETSATCRALQPAKMFKVAPHLDMIQGLPLATPLMVVAVGFQLFVWPSHFW